MVFSARLAGCSPQLSLEQNNKLQNKQSPEADPDTAALDVLWGENECAFDSVLVDRFPIVHGRMFQ